MASHYTTGFFFLSRVARSTHALGGFINKVSPPRTSKSIAPIKISMIPMASLSPVYHRTSMKTTFVSAFLCVCLAFGADLPSWEYRLLGTTKTSTMDKEMNEAAQAGFEFMSVMGGETAFGGKEVVAVMGRRPDAPGQKSYKLLAANKTERWNAKCNWPPRKDLSTKVKPYLNRLSADGKCR